MLRIGPVAPFFLLVMVGQQARSISSAAIGKSYTDPTPMRSALNAGIGSTDADSKSANTEFVEEVKERMRHWPMSVKSKYVSVIPSQPELVDEEPEKNQLIKTRSTSFLPGAHPDLDKADYSIPYNRGKQISSDPEDPTFNFPKRAPVLEHKIQEFRQSEDESLNEEAEPKMLTTRAMEVNQFPPGMARDENSYLNSVPAVPQISNDLQMGMNGERNQNLAGNAQNGGNQITPKGTQTDFTTSRNPIQANSGINQGVQPGVGSVQSQMQTNVGGNENAPSAVRSDFGTSQEQMQIDRREEPNQQAQIGLNNNQPLLTGPQALGTEGLPNDVQSGNQGLSNNAQTGDQGLQNNVQAGIQGAQNNIQPGQNGNERISDNIQTGLNSNGGSDGSPGTPGTPGNNAKPSNEMTEQPADNQNDLGMGIGMYGAAPNAPENNADATTQGTDPNEDVTQGSENTEESGEPTPTLLMKIMRAAGIPVPRKCTFLIISRRPLGSFPGLPESQFQEQRSFPQPNILYGGRAAYHQAPVAQFTIPAANLMNLQPQFPTVPRFAPSPMPFYNQWDSPQPQPPRNSNPFSFLFRK